MPKFTEEQQLAIDKDGTNIIVSAGAGSGKTAVLTARVIRKLKDGIDIDKLLILTFTSAAAKEMKERIRKSIVENKLTKQLDLLDSAYITTFDSYALSLVKKYHYLLNVSKNIKIIDSSVIEITKGKIIDEIFDEYYINPTDKFKKLIDDYCFKDDKNLKENILKLSRILDLKIDKKEYIDSYIDKYYKSVDWIIDDYIKMIKEKINDLEYYLENLKTNNDFYYKTLDILTPLFKSETFEDIKKNIKVKLPTLRDATEEEKKLKKKFGDLVKKIESYTNYSIDEMKKEILYNKENVSIILEIINKIDCRLNEFKIKYDAYEFNDIAALAIKVVRENEEVRTELKNYYNEIMVDEYQDTNDVQETFIKLIEDNNVYMVGDIKQSIYRFRNANPSIFKQKYNDYANNINGFKIDLTKNFRSRKEVLLDINKIFNSVMDINIGGADYQDSHQMVFGNTNYVDNNSYLDVYHYEIDKKYTKEEQEIFIVAKDIQEKVANHYQVMDRDTLKMRDIKYSDFCIIMDRKKEFDKYKQVFEYLNIPLVLYKDEVLNNGIDIILIKNICNFINKIYNYKYDKEFKYYFTSINRSYLMNTKDNDIYEMLTDNKFKDSELFIKCKEIAKQLDKIDSLNLINIIIDEFDFYNKTIEIGNINDTIIRLDYLKSLANNLMSVGYNVFDFIDYLNHLDKIELKYSLNTDAINNVKIMNIHKSKGLEFPVCYYTGMHKEFNDADLKDLILYDKKYGIVLPYKNDTLKDTIVKSIIKNEYIKEEISEKIRLFYVALTRAREKMIIVTSLTENSIKVNNTIKLGYKSFLDILNSIYYQLNIIEKDVNVDLNYKNLIKNNNFDKIKKSKEIITDKYLDIDNKIINQRQISKSMNKIIDKDEQEKLDLGIYIHYLFEIVDFKNPKLDNIDKKYHFYIKNLLNQPLLKDLNCNIYKEYEFMYTKDSLKKHGFIDLILEYDDYINIIDYKLKNIDDPHYIDQLNEYKTYIELKTNKKVYLYLYSIIGNKMKKL